MKRTLSRILYIFLSFLLTHANASPAPHVVVSSRPFYALVAGVMQNIAKPSLLLQQEASIHHYALKPSEMRLLKDAAVIIWGGREVEPFLTKALTHVSTATKILTLSKAPDLTLLSLRNQSGCHHEHVDNHEHIEHTFDPHFWLDPLNAIAMVNWIGQELQKIDPQNALSYQKNVTRLTKRLFDLHHSLQKELQNVKKIPYLTFHDAFQYFEKRYHLTQETTLYTQTDSTLNAKHIAAIQNKIKDKNIPCIITDTQFQPRILKAIIKAHPIRQGTVDELGLNAPLSEEGYFEMIRSMAYTIKSCLLGK